MLEKQKCCFCGSRGKRFCPARGAEICPVCCATKRGVEVDCPAACSFYPFSPAQYDQVLRIGKEAKPKMLNYVIRHFGKAALEDLAKEIQLKKIRGSDVSNDFYLAIGVAMDRLLFLTPDKQGHVLADEWRNCGWQGLTHDESISVDATSKSQVTVIEVSKILDHQTIECVDLLEPERGTFKVTDRCMARQVIRFSRMLTEVIYFPHLVCFNMTGVLIPDFIEMEELIESMGIRAKEIETDAGIKKIKASLARNYDDVSQWISECSLQHSKKMLQGMDFHDCKATYGLVGEYEKVKSVLDEHEEFDIDPQHAKDEAAPSQNGIDYVWLRVGKSKAIEKTMPSFFRHSKKEEGIGILGNISLFRDHLEVQATSLKKFEFAKKMVPFYFGELVRLQREAVVDLAKQMADHLGEDDEDEEAEEDLESVQEKIPQEIQNKLFNDYFQNHYKKFLNDKIPALHGLTPREAAKNLNARPLLIKLMKQHIHGIEKQKAEKGVEFSLDWVLDELGLSELK